ncbi:porin family protein [Hymenobacter canadensis]|uniref:Porin family protein n=1 Tax=Hymenobacter canadensis TaxID=2999067 RepID=A0ABY7LXF9_9BACT|nr:porin family protein [Hymenobacter canadensis]WBA44206.1 porin family protein [Hymenobacter canadensis]
MHRIFLSILLTTTASVAAAQTVRFGVKAGPSYTKFRGVDPAQLSSASNAYRLGFHAGVLAEVKVTDKFSVQPELLYSQKGAKNKLVNEIYTVFSYLDLPIMVKARLGETGVFLEGGPQFGYLFRATSTFMDNSYKVRDSYEKVDVGYAAGLGYQLASGPLLGFRFNGGLTRLNQPIISGGQIRATENMWNNAFQLYAGYMLGSK